jgi:geranylgeranyl diphosphate synthase, type II
MNDAGPNETVSLEDLMRALAEHAPVVGRTEPWLRSLVVESAAQPGKLARARLVLAVASAVRLDAATAILLATAVEYYHLASLLLDDLPCMDDAQMRRGQRCAHRRYDEATAILAALAFINRAYALIAFAVNAWPAAARLQVQATLDACLGAAGLVGGQARDLGFARSDRTSRTVGRIALEKTTALLWLSLWLPALLGGIAADEARHLRALGLYWGLAFQAQDDLHDVLASSVDTGKSTRRDVALNRPNLAFALGVPAARRRIRRLLAQAERQLERLSRIRTDWEPLRRWQRELMGRATGDIVVVQIVAA